MRSGIRILLVVMIALMWIASSGTATATNPSCATIQSGNILASNGDTITVGMDDYGYNYQARAFNGAYADYDRVAGGPFSEVNLQMKWNDAWLSNKDCDGDGKLDRHYGSSTYIGSGAWLTNHDNGVSEDGGTWTYFVKIVAVPADAVKVAGVWYASDGSEIGPDIWGQFAVVQQVITGSIPAAFVSYDLPFADPYRSPNGPGLGKW